MILTSRDEFTVDHELMAEQIMLHVRLTVDMLKGDNWDVVLQTILILDDNNCTM